MSSLIDLHAHDTFSLLDGYGTPDQVMDILKGLDRKAVCTTNHDNVYSHPFYQELHKKPDFSGIKPMYGCEMRFINDVKNNPRKKTHLSVIANNEEGYRNLMRLVTASHKRDCFYYLPSMDRRTLEECSEGLFIMSGCQSGMLARHILDNDLVSAVKLCKWFEKVFEDRFYLEVMPIDMEETEIIAPVLKAIHKKYGIPMVLTNDVHCLRKGGERTWKMLQSIKWRTPVQDMKHDMPNSCYYMTDDEAWEQAKKVLGSYFNDEELLGMINNQERIAADCNVVIQKPGNVTYGVDDPLGLLKQRIRDGWDRRGLKGEDYKVRIRKELDLIVRKDFIDYFLAISDITTWAKGSNILMSPSRGSSACSLIAYILGITEVDPIVYDLVMERFLSEDRTDLPDIDLDFENRHRGRVIEYMRDRFGRDKVAQMATFVKFRGRNSLAEIGKSFKVPRQDVETVQNLLVVRGSADARASFTIEDTFEEFPAAKRIVEEYPALRFSQELEGQYRHIGAHAAGVVVSSRPLIESTALIEKEDDEGRLINIASLDGNSILYLGLLKVDILALKELSQMQDISEDVGIDSKSIYTLPLDDEKALAVFDGDTLGVFQFTQPGTSSVVRQLGVDTFDDVVLCNALCVSNETRICRVMYGGAREWVQITEISENDVLVSINERDGSEVENKVEKVWSVGRREVYRITTKSGRFIKATTDHSFLTKSGWKRLGDLSVEDHMIIKCVLDKHSSGYNIEIEPILSIVYIGDEYCSDITMANPAYPSFLANYGFIVHNSRPGPLHCLDGNALIYDCEIGGLVLISQAESMGIERTLGLFPDGSISSVDVLRIECTGLQLVYRLDVDGGLSILATKGHRFMLEDGSWAELGKLSIGEKIKVWGELFKETNLPMDYDFGPVESREIISISSLDERPVYDLQIDIVHNYVADGFIVHNSGNTELVTKAKRSNNRKDWGHSLLNEITESTYGYSVFQEQVMRIMAEVGGMNYIDVAAIRNAMSKSYGDEFFNKYRQIFKDGAMNLQGFSDAFCDEVFDHVSTFGCLSEDTRIPFLDKRGVPRRDSIKYGYDKFHNPEFDDFPLMIYSLGLNGEGMVRNLVTNVIFSGKKMVYELATPHNHRIKASADHRFMTPADLRSGDCGGWRNLSELEVGQFVCGASKDSVHAEKIVSITPVGEMDTYDISMKGPHHSYLAEGLIVHNSWSFNKAHSVGYSLVSYAVAYLKAYYPRTFYKVLCNHEDPKGDKLKAILREYLEKGLGEVLPPKIGRSGTKWVLDGDNLRAGLETVLPAGACEEIASLAPIVSREDLISRARRRKVNSRAWDLIEEHMLFDDDDSYDPFGLYAFAERIGQIKHRTHKIGDIGFAFDFRTITIAGVLDKQVNLKTLTELRETSKLKDWSKRFDESAGEEWAILYLRDESGLVNVHVKNYLYPKVKELIWSRKVGDDILVITGSVPPSMNYVIAKDIKPWNDVKIVGAKCYKCGLFKNNFCPPGGNPEAKVFLLGMCPGEVEINTQRGFSGPAGDILDEAIVANGANRDGDFWWSNSVLCRPLNEHGRNADPEDQHIDSCSDRLFKEIERIAPVVVVPLGRVAYKALTGENVSINSVAGSKIETGKYIIVPSLHPASCLYGDDDGSKKSSIKRSIALALEISGVGTRE